MTTAVKSMKRIHKVTIKRMIDESPDTSWLGEYGNSAESDYSIDRAHSRDCHSIEANHRNVVETLEHAITYLGIERTAAGDDPNNTYWEVARKLQEVTRATR